MFHYIIPYYTMLYYTSLVLCHILSLKDPNGMQQELWWAHEAHVPIVPFYDGDHHTAQDYAAWQKDFPFALKRPPVVYTRAGHLRAKAALVAGLHDALQDCAYGSIPPEMAEVLEKLARKQAKRARRGEREGEEGGARQPREKRKAPSKAAQDALQAETVELQVRGGAEEAQEQQLDLRDFTGRRSERSARSEEESARRRYEAAIMS